MEIRVATYEFSKGKIFVAKPLEVIRETEQSYFVKANNAQIEYKFLKSDIGQVKYIKRDNRPYITIEMIDATQEEVKAKIAEWFIQQADTISKK